MKNNNGYKTKQKESLLAFLKNNKDRHTNVREISAYLTSEGTPMGTATIYRQLDKLVEQGEVRKYILDSSTGACYQYIADEHCHQHFHLKCNSCGTLIHLDCGYMDKLSEHIFQHHAFAVDPSQTVFYGICEKCRKESEH